MFILAKLIGIVIIIAGAIFLISPNTGKKHMDFCLKGKKLYLGGLLRIIMGVILILASQKSRIPSIVVILGCLVVLKGMLIFILGLEKVKSMIKWWQARPSAILRLMALLAIGIGILLVYSI
jgi:ABC-type xylose transport system permease subunit